ncbi:MAG TPA: Crp/Fnr family transcriptional regulator [Anaerolineae bacterium]|nr:Crp/Fnr family transcriptional regulator [Anaerolineae bacterium]
MPVDAQALANLPFFSRLDAAGLAEVAPHVREVALEPGQVAVWEGEPCSAVYFVVRGLVRTRRMSLNGREHVLSYLGAGTCFNLVPALDGKPNPLTVDAVTATTLYSVACSDCRSILARNSEMAHALLEHLAGEVRTLSDTVESLALHTVRARLARFLLDIVSGKAPPRAWTQEEVAAHIGTVREMVGRTLRDFTKEGLIRRERGRIVVLDPDRLTRESGS